jgi:hypothetical protein
MLTICLRFERSVFSQAEFGDPLLLDPVLGEHSKIARANSVERQPAGVAGERRPAEMPRHRHGPNFGIEQNVSNLGLDSEQVRQSRGHLSPAEGCRGIITRYSGFEVKRDFERFLRTLKSTSIERRCRRVPVTVAFW